MRGTEGREKVKPRGSWHRAIGGTFLLGLFVACGGRTTLDGEPGSGGEESNGGKGTAERPSAGGRTADAEERSGWDGGPQTFPENNRKPVPESPVQTPPDAPPSSEGHRPPEPPRIEKQPPEPQPPENQPPENQPPENQPPENQPPDAEQPDAPPDSVPPEPKPEPEAPQYLVPESDGPSLSAVYGGGGKVWAVGQSGTALHWSPGANPRSIDETTLVAPPTEAALREVWVSPSGHAWVVSEHGELFRYADSGWQEFEFTDGTPRSIWGTADDDIWVSGAPAEIWHSTDGSNFDHHSTLEATPDRILGTGEGGVVASGSALLSTLDGQSWIPLSWAPVPSYVNWKWIMPGAGGTFWISGALVGMSNLIAPQFIQVDGRADPANPVVNRPTTSGNGGPITVLAGWPLESGEQLCAVEYYGKVPGSALALLRNGSTWTHQGSLPTSGRDMWGDEEVIWLVGASGLIVRLSTETGLPFPAGDAKK